MTTPSASAPQLRFPGPPALGGAVAGHLRTVAALFGRLLWPTPAPPSEPFRTTVDDPATGLQPVRGLLSGPRAGGRLVVLLHGLGGSPRSAYMARLATAAHGLGMAALRLSLRGADGGGPDLYHAGLTADLHAALADQALADFDQVWLAGLSLGGHVALRYACEPGDPRLVAVAAVSAPLDLAAGAAAIDRPLMAPYRAYLLRGLRAHAARAWHGGLLPTPPERLRRVRTLHQWDGLTVAPRFGFAGAGDYYARASVGPRLGSLRCPALLLSAAADPMVPPGAIQPAIEAAGRPAPLTVRWARRGGHLAFAGGSGLGLGLDGDFSLQVLTWLERQDGRRAR